ncbi:hypothetical protein DFH09DRAFT_1341800 [Mycena vulgaris]|nr:hypothetical protein DFH09DRAFT_1341800 [Mycena vulgaris]
MSWLLRCLAHQHLINTSACAASAAALRCLHTGFPITTAHLPASSQDLEDVDAVADWGRRRVRRPERESSGAGVCARTFSHSLSAALACSSPARPVLVAGAACAQEQGRMVPNVASLVSTSICLTSGPRYANPPPPFSTPRSVLPPRRTTPRARGVPRASAQASPHAVVPRLRPRLAGAYARQQLHNDASVPVFPSLPCPPPSPVQELDDTDAGVCADTRAESEYFGEHHAHAMSPRTHPGRAQALAAGWGGVCDHLVRALLCALECPRLASMPSPRSTSYGH